MESAISFIMIMFHTHRKQLQLIFTLHQIRYRQDSRLLDNTEIGKTRMTKELGVDARLLVMAFEHILLSEQIHRRKSVAVSRPLFVTFFTAIAAVERKKNWIAGLDVLRYVGSYGFDVP